MYLMRFHSLKKGSFERFLIVLTEKAGKNFNFVFVFSEEPPDWLRKELENRGGKIDWSPCGTNRKGFKDIKRLMITYRPDVVHVHFFSLLSPFIPYIRWRFGVRVIVHIHSVIPYEFGRTRLRTMLIPLRKWLVANSVSRFIAVSEFVRTETAFVFPFKPDQVVIVYNGVEPARPEKETTSDIRSTLKISENSFVIIAAAWLNEIKGIHILIESLPKIREAVNDNVETIIVGDGPERPRLEELARSLGLSKKVHFLGWRDDVPGLIKESDIVVAPSICKEAFSYIVLEAMAAGKPIVASDMGGISELIGAEPAAGILVRPGDPMHLAESIIWLIKDPQKRQNISVEAQRKSLNEFHIYRQIGSLEEIYSDLTALNPKLYSVSRKYLFGRKLTR